MSDISGANYDALQSRMLVVRDFIWFEACGDMTSWRAGHRRLRWSDIGDINAQIVDPDTGGIDTRSFAGAGALIQISDIPLVSSLTVQNITVTLSQVADRVNELVRGYDCKQGRVEIYRGLFDPLTRQMVAPAEPRFVGFIDEAPITTPAEGQSGDVSLSCTSNTSELTRTNPDTRSDASQQLRAPGERFLRTDVAVVGAWQQFWGRAGGVVRSTDPSAMGSAGPAPSAAASTDDERDPRSGAGRQGAGDHAKLKHSRAAAGFDRADGLTRFTFPFDPAWAERLFSATSNRIAWRSLLEAEGVVAARRAAGGGGRSSVFGLVKLARETMWWIEPDYRGASAMRMLSKGLGRAMGGSSEGCRYSGMGGMGEFP